MNYKANWDEGVRPCIKNDISDVKFEVKEDNELHVFTDQYPYSVNFEGDDNIIAINYKVFKSKLLTTLFNVVE